MEVLSMDIVLTWKDGRVCAESKEIPKSEVKGNSPAEALGRLVLAHSDKLTLPLNIINAN